MRPCTPIPTTPLTELDQSRRRDRQRANNGHISPEDDFMAWTAVAGRAVEDGEAPRLQPFEEFQVLEEEVHRILATLPTSPGVQAAVGYCLRCLSFASTLTPEHRQRTSLLSCASGLRTLSGARLAAKSMRLLACLPPRGLRPQCP
jgi:hypothetical protein